MLHGNCHIFLSPFSIIIEKPILSSFKTFILHINNAVMEYSILKAFMPLLKWEYEISCFTLDSQKIITQRIYIEIRVGL